MSGLDDYVNSLKSSVVTIGESLIYGWAVSKFPFLGWPIISTIFRAVIRKMLSDGTNAAEFQAFAKYIDLRTNKQGTAFSISMAEYHAAKLSGDKERTANAEKTVRQNFADLARLST